nr:TraU family protein [Alphaproteobacteria bacterium]
TPVPPVCSCPLPPPLPPKVGVPVSLWEPVRVAEVVRDPFCFPSLDGESIDAGSLAGRTGGLHEGATDWHVHWFTYPLLSWMEFTVTGACADIGTSWDLGYMTEIDPLWNNDELAFFLTPESVLFSNILAQATCAADCIAANVTNALDTFFWCAGCQGGVYPLSSRALHTSEIQSSITAVEKMTYKLHRQLLARDTTNPLLLCSSTFSPIWKKGQYRTQPVLPVPSTSGTFACSPYGRSTFFYEWGKTIPTQEHYAYLIWRKRLCCAF